MIICQVRTEHLRQKILDDSDIAEEPGTYRHAVSRVSKELAPYGLKLIGAAYSGGADQLHAIRCELQQQSRPSDTPARTDTRCPGCPRSSHRMA